MANEGPGNPNPWRRESAGQSFVAPKAKLLKLRLVAVGRNGMDRYAVVPFPPTYGAAKTSAVEAFKQYMVNPTPDDILLRCSARNREGGCIWADMVPLDWDTVMQEFNGEVGVFWKKAFVRGKVYISYGHVTNGYETIWTCVSMGQPTIDRPESYEKAIEYITNFKASHHLSDQVQGVNLREKNVTFYTFTSTFQNHPGSWEMFPPATQTDDYLWRQFVPEPAHVLGFKID
ncbi:hypothetical protein F5887DRAFT_541163 [Amanita rubescens]|nr:hypothetical protein F5887DRAFT_541163 [Amanita rubescens]